MNKNELKNEPTDRLTDSYVFHSGVAREIAILLAKRNVHMSSVDRVFMFVNDMINSIPLGLALDNFQGMVGCESEQHRISYE